MPSVSKKQHNFMAAVAKNPAFAKKVGIKPSVGEEFLKADKGKKFKEGGIMTRYVPGFKGPMAPAAGPRAASTSGTRAAPAAGVGMTRASGTRATPAAGVGMTRASGTRATPAAGVGMKKGGDIKESKAMVKKEIGFMKKAGAPKSMIKHEQAEAKGMKKGGMACSPAAMKKTAKTEVKSHEKKMHGMAKGGGIEVKGKTKGTMVKMKKGGYC